MLKVFRGLVLTVAMIVANAYVPPTYAASANVVITHIQAGGVGAALEELVFIYNNSPDEVDITHWCVKNKSNVDIVCFLPYGPAGRVYLPAHSYATIASSFLVAAHYGTSFSGMYSPSNQSSGSIIGSSDMISLVDRAGIIVDSYEWTTSLAGGSLFERKLSSDTLSYIDTDQPTDWQIGTLQGVPPNSVVRRDVLDDLCLNIDGTQLEVPEGLELKADGSCLPPLSQLYITELLPNASGSDTGHEFIELYNPNSDPINLDNYLLRIGPTFETEARFPAGSTIGPYSYVVFDNAVMNYSLLNTSSRVQLVSLGGLMFDEVPRYENPDDDESWALIEGIWQYTSQPTPGGENRASDALSSDASTETVALQPCAANQYRSPETNRCRLISTPATVTPCKDGQYRSEETNRCRNIASDADLPKPCEEGEERNAETGRCRKIVVASVPTPCKEGQERNPETNRCRNIVAMTKADYAVLGTQSQSNNNWYIWAAIIGLLLAILGYAAWEWRWELGKLRDKLLKFVRIRK
ncbi:MAG: lamin tail domain-containing protein [Candidatus Microsaccharimonas sp.]